MHQSSLPTGLFCCLFTIFAQAGEKIDSHVRLVPDRHTSLISRLSLDTSESFLLSVSIDKSAILWDAKTGEALNAFFSPLDGISGEDLYAAALTSDASIAAIAGLSANRNGPYWIYLFDPFSNSLIRRLGPLRNPVSDLVFTPDKRLLVASFYHGGCSIYDTGTWKVVAQVQSKHSIYSTSANNHTGIVTAGGDGSVNIYSRDSFSVRRLMKSTRIPYSAAFSPMNSSVAVGFSGSSTIAVIDLLSGEKRETPFLKGHTDNMSVVGWLDPNHLVSATGSMSSPHSPMIFTVWGQPSFRPAKRFRAGLGAPTDMVITRSDEIIISSANAQLSRFDTSGGLLFSHSSPLNHLSSFKISENADWFEFSDKDSRRRIGLADDSLFSPDGNNIVSEDQPRHPLIKSSESPIHIALDEGHPQYLQVHAHKKVIVLKDTQTNRLKNFRVGSDINQVAYAPTSAQLVVSHRDGVIRWYRRSDGQQTLSACVFADSHDWLAWTPSGYWSGSVNGDQLLKVLIDQEEQMPISYALDYIKAPLHSPSKIAQAARGALYQKDILHRSLTPHVRIIAPRVIEAKADSVTTIEVMVWSPPLCGLSEIDVKVNGLKTQPLLRGLRTFKNNVSTYAYRVKLVAGDNTVKASARNCNGMGQPASINIAYHPASSPASTRFETNPGLNILSIGISRYQNRSFDLSYAEKDAREFVLTMAPEQKSLYSSFKIRTYTDSKAIRDSILNAFEWLSREASARDVTMIFMAGHGITDHHNRFYFLPHNARADRLLASGISDDDLETALVRIPGKVICFLDACFAGRLNPSRRSLPLNIPSLVKQIEASQSGVILFSSSMATQFSEELHHMQNGAFSKAVIEGLQGRADFYGGGYVTVNMLEAYISERVKELTNGRQAPVTTKPPGMRDYPIAVTGGS